MLEARWYFQDWFSSRSPDQGWKSEHHTICHMASAWLLLMSMSPVLARKVSSLARGALARVAVWPAWKATSFQAWAAWITAAQSSLALVKFVVLLYNGYLDHIPWRTVLFCFLPSSFSTVLLITLLSVLNIALECVVKIKQKNRQQLRCKEKKVLTGETRRWLKNILTCCGTIFSPLHCY